MNILDVALAGRIAASGSGGGGTDNYNDLSNLPQINGETLAGNKSSSNLGLQDEIDSDNKLASDLVDDTNQDNKFVTSTEKNTWNGKQNAIDSDHKLSSDLVDDANKTNKFVTSTEKNTWNAKQNAIDSDHKLSSSLVSFSTAEAAALASGIDSSKVGQISTNQTNILLVQSATEELVDDGAKNKLKLDKDAIKSLNSGGTWLGYVYTPTTAPNLTVTINDDSTVTLNGSTGSSLVTVALERKASSGFQGYVLSGSKANTKLVYQLAVSPYTVYATADGVGSDVISNYTDGSTIQLSLQIVANSTFSNTVITPMICTLADWNVSQKCVPPALPNYDLTVREAEDRAALAEVVNSGAKNPLDFANLVSLKTQNATVTKTDTTVTVTSNNTWGYQSYLLDLRAGKYELSFNATAVSISSGRMFVAVFPGQTAEGHIVQVDVTSTGAKHGSFEWTGGELNISFYANPSNVQIVNSMTITDVMICSEADWKVSQNYVPYRKNLDQLEATKAPALDTGAGVNSGSLDDVSENTFAIYTTNVSNLPTNTSYYYVETIVYSTGSSGYAIQKAYSVTDGASYIRVKNTGTWSAWKQITNA